MRITAAEGVLVSVPPSRLTFGPGAATAMLRLGTRADAVDKPDAPVTLTVEDGAAWTPGDPSEATVTVRDDDLPVVTVAAASDAVLEGEAAAFTLTRTEGDLSAALTVAVAVAAAEGVLASTPPSTVTFEADAATATLPLGTQDDGVGEVDVTVTLTLEAGAGYDREDPTQATVTVAEDDLPVVSIAPAAPVEEGGTLEFVVSMAHPNAAAVPVAWRLGGTAAAGDDYTGSASGTVVFAPGEIRKVISVATVDDGADEPEETVEASIVVGAPGRPGPATEATGRIRDDDLPVVAFAAANATIVQGQHVSLTIERAGDLSAELFVGFEVVSGGSFFAGPTVNGAREVNFEPYSDTNSFQVLGGLTTSAPQDYTITVALLPRSPFSSGDRQYDLGSPSRITITARVDDGIPRVSIADATVTEGDTLSFPVSLDGPSEQEVEVTYQLRGSAVTGEDYSGDSTIILPTPEVPVPRGTLTFAPGDVFEEIVLETEDDSAAEPEETVEIELVVGQDAGVAYGPSTRATGRIRDDDLPVVTVAAVSERIAEGDEAAFTLTRAGDRSQPLTVEALLTDGTLPLPAAVPVSASFGAGDAAATLRLTTRDDAVAEADAAVLLALLDGAAYDLGDPSRAVVTVRDDDRRPEVSIADAAPVAEGGTLAFPVRLSIPGSEAITVGYTLAGTATAGADYVGGASGSVTFAPGVTERTIRLATLADGADEAQERVQASIVTVAMAGSVEIVRPGSKTAAGTILDIDLPSVTVAPVAAAVVEGEDAAFTLTRVGDLSAALAVSFAFKDAAGVLTSAAPAGTVFGPGAETVRVTLTTGNDEVDEADAALTLTLRPDAGYDRGDPHQATVTVRDDDPGSVAVAPAAAAVTEGAAAVFVLTRAGDRSAALEVSFTIEDAAGVLAAAAPAGAAFGPGAATALVTLATVDDGADEADAALTLTLQADARYDLGVPHQATVTVRDDDLPVVTIAAVADEVAEGAAAAFTLARAGDSSVPLVVGIQVTSTGSSVLVSPADFLNVRFEPGMATHTLRLDTRDDTAVEADATLTLTLGRRASLVLGDPSSATVTVQDNDAQPDVSIADAAPVTEGGTLVFPVTLTRPFGAEIRIPYSYRSEGGTATEGRDYTNASDHGSEVVFAPGKTERTLRFATVVDGADEDEETVQVVILPAASIGAVQRDRATGRIQDNILPVVTVTGVAFVYEGRDVVFTLTRDRKLQQEPLEVSVSFQESTSVLAEEAPASVRFGAGESTATLRLGTDDDAVDERDNTVTLQLVAGAAYERGDPSTAIVIVFDNDLPAVTVAADAAAVTEGEAAAFTLTRAGNLASGLTVPVVVTDPGSVLIGTPPASVRFGARNATAVLRLDTQDDAVVEPDAVVTLALTDGASYDLGMPSQAAVTVRDDDGLPDVSIADAAPVTEGGVLEFPVRLSHRSDTRIVVAADYRFTGAAGGAVTFTVAFAPGDTEETISLATVDDDADDGQETVEVTLAAPDPALAVLGAASRATGRILDDDGRSEVTVAAVADAVTEGADAAFTLTRANGDMSAALVVAVTVTDAGAVLTDTPPASVTFGAGEAAATLRLRTQDDAVDEPDAAVTLTLTAGAAWELGAPAQATVTVRDDERPVVTVTPEADAVAEGADTVFTLARAGDLTAALVVSVQVTDAGSVLIGTPPSSVSFGAGDATATLRLGTQDDAGSGEDDTAVILALDDGAEYDLGTPWEATVTVRDDDAAPEVSIAAAQPAPEGGTLAFPVTLTRPYREAVAVPYRFDDGGADTAVEGADYHDAASVKELTFAPGEMRQVVSLVTVDDGDYEGEETVSVTLAAPSPGPGTLGTATAAGRILDDDIPVVTVMADAATVTEGADAVFTLARAGDRSAALVVPVTVTDAGAVLADTPPAGVSFSAGDATAALRLGTDDDEADEPDTALTLTLADGADHDLGTPSEAVVTVRDDDLPEVSIAAAEAVVEGGTLAFAVRLSSPAAAHFSVAYNLTGTAVAGVDHAGSTTGAVTFAPGMIEQTLRLVTVDDDTDEPEETVVVELIDPSGVPSPQAQLGRPSSATGRILDDDLPVVTVAADAAMVTEGADAAFTLTRAGDASEALTVSFAVTDGGAVLTGTAPTDVTFQAGMDTARVTLATEDDGADEADAAVTLTVQSDPAWNLGTPSAATVTVRDDEHPAVTVATDTATITEGGDAVFTLTRTLFTAAELEVTVAVTETGAVLTGAAPVSVRFGAGDATATLRLGTDDDDADEPETTVTVALADGADYDLGDPSQAAVTVRDDDLPVVTVAAESEQVVEEGGDVAFLLTRTAGDLSAALTVGVLFKRPGQEASSGSNRFGPGDATLRLGGFPAENVEADDTFVMTLQPGAGYRLGAPSAATVTVRDDDATPSVSIAAAEAVVEGGTLAFPVMLSGPYHSAITVRYTLAGTAAVGDDYTDDGAGTVTFAPRTTEQTIRLATVDDDIDETGERVEATLAAGADYTLGAPLAATGRILDDEGTSEVTVVAAADAVTEGEAAVFTLTRVEGDVSQALAVPVAIEDADGVLLPGAPSSVTFAAGDATATVRLGTDDDTLDEPDAAVTLTLAAGAGYDLGTPAAATVTVRDDDAPPAVSIAAADPVPEGGALEFVVSLSHPSTATVAVDYRLGGTAVAGSDYRGDAAGAVTFTPGVTEQRIRLVTVGNDLDGADRTVTVTLAAPDPGLATLGDPSSAAGRIEDDDLPLVTIAPDAFAVREGRDVAFTLTRANTDLSAELEVAVAVTDTGGVLTDAAPTSVSFAAGEAAATLRLGTDDDDIAEPDAVTVTVTLVAGGTYDLGTPAEATVTVRDTEARPVVSIAHDSVTEGGTLHFAVSLNRASAAEIAVGYTVTHGNTDIDATAGADYLGPASGTLTFAPGDRRKLISIETVDDDDDEPTERFHVTLLPPDSRLARLSSNPILRVASGQIRDNDLQTVTVEAVSDAVGEWNVLDHLGDHEVRDKRMFLVTRTRGDEVSKPLTVTFTIGDEDGVLATSPLPTGETFAAHDFEQLVLLATDD